MRLYTIPTPNWAKLEKSVARLNKQLSKTGHPGVTYQVTEEVALPDPDREGAAIPCKIVQVDGLEPVVNGWHFVARLVHTTEGNIVRAVPGFEVSPAFRECEPNCDHCNVKRARRDTFIVRHEDGRQVQVGSSCMRDFLTADPKAVCRATELFLEAFDVFDSATNRNWLGGGGTAEPYRIFTADYLAHVARVVEVEGRYITRKLAQETQRPSTSSVAYNVMFHRETYGDDDLWRNYCPTEANHDLASQAVDWVRDQYEETVDVDDDDAMFAAVVHGSKGSRSLNDFEHNLLAVAKAASIEPRLTGIAAYAIEAYRRDLASKSAPKSPSQHVGQLKDRLRGVKAIVRFVHFIEGDMYSKTIVKFEDEAGNVYTWFASGDQTHYQIGDKIVVTGTVKKHDEYKGQKQTVLTRCEVCAQEAVKVA